ALIGVWYVNFYDYRSMIISPYNTRLARFPAYIQQLEMESNGKSVDVNGNYVSYNTCPVIWGDSGINGQHAYYQLLHQGKQIIPMDIIITLSDKFSSKEHNNILWSNAIAQAEAFMCGKTESVAKSELIKSGVNEKDALFLAKHKTFPGNRPSNMIILPEISPFYLGSLIALYEHKTFVQGVVWNVNSFDQMGVELGKQLAKKVLQNIEDCDEGDHDASTAQAIANYLQSSIEK
ncbi:MAG: glucose-6-phosphate isomerase, partial [Burkholderiales bacterium]|nr:glucose-6-phosphate isomerase [Burkholderiales bacterium]